MITLEHGQVAPRSSPRLLTAIHSGSELLGVIWACEGTTPFGADAVSALSEFAHLAAPVLTKRRLALSLRRDRTGRMLVDLLECAGDHRALLATWNKPEEAATVLVALEPCPGMALDPGELVHLLTVQVGTLGTPAAAAAIGSTVYVLAVVPTGGDCQTVRSRIVGMGRRVEGRTGAQLLTAVSAPRRVSHVGESRLEVERIMRVLRLPTNRLRTAEHTEVEQAVALLELEDFLAERRHLHLCKLDAIRQHDRWHGTAYFLSLTAFLDAFGDIRAAAERVALHPNSFRYRLRRLVELFDVQLDDPDERLLLQLVIRCRTTTDSEPGPPPR